VFVAITLFIEKSTNSCCYFRACL